MQASVLAVGLVGSLLLGSRARAVGDIFEHLPLAQEYLDEARRHSGLSGVILIARHDAILFQEAYGYAELEHGVEMQVDTVFRIGSLSKPITASAVLMAVDRGLLDLDTELGAVLPEAPEGWRAVTVWQLLNHSSGIPDRFGDLESVPVDETVSELLRVLGIESADAALEAPAGSEYTYSNFNYVLLGAMLERSVGLPWEAVLRSWVFEELDLDSIAYDDVYAVVENRARGYRRDPAGRLRNIDYDDHAAYAAGGLLATAGDLFGWFRALLDGLLVSDSLLDASFAPHLGNYALGWQVREFFDRTIYNHSGGIDGFSSHLAYYPDEKLSIIILLNVENDAAVLYACDLARILFEGVSLSQQETATRTPRARCGLDD